MKNCWVPSVALRVGVADVGPAALPLDASGRVRADADMVFHGQLHHPSGAVGYGSSGLALALHGVEPVAERIVTAGPADRRTAAR